MHVGGYKLGIIEPRDEGKSILIRLVKLVLRVNLLGYRPFHQHVTTIYNLLSFLSLQRRLKRHGSQRSPRPRDPLSARDGPRYYSVTLWVRIVTCCYVLCGCGTF